MRSSLSAASSFQLQRRGSASSAARMTPGLSVPSPLKGQSYGTVGLNLSKLNAGVGQVPDLATDLTADSLLSIQPYLLAMGHKTMLQADGDRPVTSFVPSEPSVYQEHMQRADRHFRQGSFSKAADAYEVALTYARHSPEPHLGKVHAKFALGQYNTAAYHLRKALTLLPELALTRVEVRGFYGRVEDFVAHLEKLREAVEKLDSDQNVRLVFAYFRYFDGAEAEAARAIREASELSGRAKDKDTAEAAQRFWDGMVTAGKVSGSLAPTTQPTGTLGPAEGSKPPVGSTVGQAAGRENGNI